MRAIYARMAIALLLISVGSSPGKSGCGAVPRTAADALVGPGFDCFGRAGPGGSARTEASAPLLKHVGAVEQSGKRPTLVVMISVDMLSGEIMDRYGSGLPGGLGRLQREGVFFENGFQE